MSEEYTSSIDGYAEAQSEVIAARAGIADALGEAVALAGQAVSGTVSSLLDAVQRAEEGMSNRVFSTEEWALSNRSKDTTRAVVSTRAWLDTLQRPEYSVLRAAAAVEQPSLFASIASTVDQLERRLASASSREALARAAGSVRQQLQAAVTSGANRVTSVQGAVLDKALSETLTEMGYRQEPRRVETVRGRHIIRGTSQKGTSIYIAHDPRRGHLMADMSGFSGSACTVERRRLLDGLARRGVKVRLLERRQHGRLSGGALAREAGLADQGGAARAWSGRASAPVKVKNGS